MRTYPIDNCELTKMQRGRRHDAVIPIHRGERLTVGQTVRFAEAVKDYPDGFRFVPGVHYVDVTVTKVRNEHVRYGDDEVLFYIAWEALPATIRRIADPVEVLVN